MKEGGSQYLKNLEGARRALAPKDIERTLTLRQLGLLREVLRFGKSSN